MMSSMMPRPMFNSGIQACDFGSLPFYLHAILFLIANKNLAITIKFTDHKFCQISIYEYVNHLHLCHHQRDNTIHI